MVVSAEPCPFSNLLVFLALMMLKVVEYLLVSLSSSSVLQQTHKYTMQDFLMLTVKPQSHTYMHVETVYFYKIA